MFLFWIYFQLSNRPIATAGREQFHDSHDFQGNPLIHTALIYKQNENCLKSGVEQLIYELESVQSCSVLPTSCPA